MTDSQVPRAKSFQLCRNCFNISEDRGFGRCTKCFSPRIVCHKELLELNIAHVDCDAFYASIEKLENPELQNYPVIVGGSHRGVVATCCYLARVYGVRSAMPMREAKKICPEAIIIPPRISFYKAISQKIKMKLMTLSPSVEFVSIDEAYIDLSGTSQLHKMPPAAMLARVAKDIEVSLGLTVSIGLSHNKLLAKMASEEEKPQGFSIIGKCDFEAILLKKHIKMIPGIGPQTIAKFEKYEVRIVSDLLKFQKDELNLMFGSFGKKLWYLARGIDERKVLSKKQIKSLSCEKTLTVDEGRFEVLQSVLWTQCEKIAQKAKDKNLVPQTIKLKLKRSNFKLLVISSRNEPCTNSAEIMFQILVKLLIPKLSKGPFRLIGISISQFMNKPQGAYSKDLFNTQSTVPPSTEAVIDDIRRKYGARAIIKGRSLLSET